MGTLWICRNYDEPGKIRVVGGRPGKSGVNIRLMTVATIEGGSQGGVATDGESGLAKVNSVMERDGSSRWEKEALMILGVDKWWGKVFGRA